MTEPTSSGAPVLDISALSKGYHALRPLRIERMTLGKGERCALLGFDQPMAEVFINLVTGAILPDRGEVRVFGRSTASIDDSGDWLAVVDRIGIVSERAVLLDAFSVLQNLAMPFTLEIDPPPDEIRQRAVTLAREVGLGESDLASPVLALGTAGRARLRLARALALDPQVLLLEHASAGIPAREVPDIASTISRIATLRGCALVAVTADRRFAAAVGARPLTLEPATGRLTERRAFLDKFFF